MDKHPTSILVRKKLYQPCMFGANYEMQFVKYSYTTCYILKDASKKVNISYFMLSNVVTASGCVGPCLAHTH